MFIFIFSYKNKYSYQLYKLNEATRALIIHYGGRNQQATNIVFTNGILNPWVYDGITQYDGSGSYVYNMQCKFLIII